MSYDRAYYAVHGFTGLVGCALGGWAFGEWQHSFPAGFFMFVALDAITSIAMGLYCLAYKPHDR